MNFPLIQRLVEEMLAANLAGERADRALANVLRAHRQLTSEERRAVAEWSLGIALWRGRLDRMARGDRTLWLPLFLIDRAGWSVEDTAAATRSDGAVVRSALAVSPPDDPAERLAFEQSLPLWLANRWIHQFGLERANGLARAMNQRGPIAVRANLLRETRDTLQSRLSDEGVASTPSPLVETALILSGRPNINGLQSWREGLFEVQDEGSQLIANAVEAKPDQLVIDLCAGAGGKTLALAAQMRNRGRLIASDVDPQRLIDLDVRARRAGATCVETRVGDARQSSLWTDLERRADAVLVDAPCSSLGTLRRGPDARWRLSQDAPREWSHVQVGLLQAASHLVRPGGRLIYATCSIDLVENEQVARTLSDAAFQMEHENRTSPDMEGCDGFYWCVFSRARTS